MSNYIDNIQFLCRFTKDAKHDIKQWTVLSGKPDPAADSVELGLVEKKENYKAIYRSDNIGNTRCFINILQNTIKRTQVIAGSKKISDIVQ